VPGHTVLGNLRGHLRKIQLQDFPLSCMPTTTVRLTRPTGNSSSDQVLLILTGPSLIVSAGTRIAVTQSTVVSVEPPPYLTTEQPHQLCRGCISVSFLSILVFALFLRGISGSSGQIYVIVSAFLALALLSLAGLRTQG
jgi:hypothetical protein